MTQPNAATAGRSGEDVGHRGMPMGLDEVLRNPAVWRLGQLPPEKRKGIASGYQRLDRELPENGWPVGALTELLTSQRGIGELSILLPALRSVSEAKRGIALLAPPLLPNPGTWEMTGISVDRMLIVEAKGTELLWAAEQVLRSGECGAVLLWIQSPSPNYKALQRLHMAAGKGNSICIFYRPADAQSSPSPAPLRLALRRKENALEVSVIKRRGAIGGKPFKVKPFPIHWDISNTLRPHAEIAAPTSELLSLAR